MKSRKIDEKVIAVLRICGVIEYKVTNYHNFIKPTPEQIANLKRLLNIDVILLDEETEAKPEEVVEGTAAEVAEEA